MSDEPTAPGSAREIRFDGLPEALTPPARFLEMAAGYGLEFDDGDLDRLGQFLALLLKANELFNLTAIKEVEAAWEKHIFDALTLLPLLGELPEGSRVADVGSGGGVPGVPLALVLPSLKFTLIEATGKKAAFLGEVIRLFGLTNVEVVNERAEVVGQDHRGQREHADAVLARALGPLAVAVELTAPLAKVGGRVILIKGQKAEEELEAGARAMKLLGVEHEGTLETPTGKLVVLAKTARTPRTYPRKAGEPKRAPL